MPAGSTAGSQKEETLLGWNIKRVFLVFFAIIPLIVHGQIITTVAGTGAFTSGSDGNPATATPLKKPGKVIVDDNGDLYIAETWAHKIRKVDYATGFVTTIAGTGVAGYNGDNIAASSAQLYNPCGLALDVTGNLYVADGVNHRVRKINKSTGIITTVAGNEYGAGGYGGFSGDLGPATAAELNAPGYIVFDKNQHLYISDHLNRRIRKVDIVSGIITTYAGNGSSLYAGDGGVAAAASFSPEGIAFDKLGNLYIADTNSAIRKIDASSNIISTVAGIGVFGYSGDGASATSAEIKWPFDISFNRNGTSFFIAEYGGRIRSVDVWGIIQTAAGTATYGYNGDSIAATNAKLNETTGIFVDTCDNLFIADASNGRIRKVTYNPFPCASLSAHIVNTIKFDIYPNPAKDAINVDNIQGASVYRLTNMLGIIQQGTLKASSNTISIQSLPTGVYLLEISNNEGERTVMKIVKQ